MIAAYDKLNIDALLYFANRICLFVLGAALCFFVAVLVFYPSENHTAGTSLERRASFSKSSASFSYESIGSGALALNPSQLSGWVSNIARDLMIMAHNSRPDVSQREAKILIALKNLKEDRKSIVSGKTLFLEEGKEGVGFFFTDTPQSLWIKPILLDNGRVLVEVGRRLGSLDAPQSEEKGQFVVSETGDFKRSSIFCSAEPYIQALKSARCWGKDCLIEQYGGREFQYLKEKYKIECGSGACFVSQGDYLIWKRGQWIEVVGDDNVTDAPIAQVLSLSSQGLEIAVWDESGFYPVQISLPLEPAMMHAPKADRTLSSVRLRTAAQVSCVLGKKRMILKAGDWLLKTAAGWRTLRKKEDIEHCLRHRIRGELFIFDGLEKQQGSWFLKGNLFNEMRTEVQPMNLPIDVEKKKEAKGARKHRSPFQNSKIELSLDKR